MDDEAQEDLLLIVENLRRVVKWWEDNQDSPISALANFSRCCESQATQLEKAIARGARRVGGLT